MNDTIEAILTSNDEMYVVFICRFFHAQQKYEGRMKPSKLGLKKQISEKKITFF